MTNVKGIKLTGTKFRNFAGFSAIEVEYPDGVVYLCGNNGAGKSGLTLEGLQACIKGIAEKDTGGNIIGARFAFIGETGKSADIQYRFHDQRNGRFFTITNHLTAGKNDIRVEAQDNEPIPQDWLNDFLSISLMSETHFCSLTSKEQALALGVKTDTFDQKISDLKKEATEINRELKIYSHLSEVAQVQEVDISALQEKRRVIMTDLNNKYLDNINHNKNLRQTYEEAKHRHEIGNMRLEQENRERVKSIARCRDALNILNSHGYSGLEVATFIEALPKAMEIDPFCEMEPTYIIEQVDDAPLREIDSQIHISYENNIAAQNYREYLAKCTQRDELIARQKGNEEAQEKVKKERLEYIASFDFGYANLSTNDKGELELDGRPLRKPYFSTGERIRIVSKLMAAQHPLFKTVFLDSACELDPQNLEEVIKILTTEGFNVIVSIPNEKIIEGKHCIVLRNCNLLSEDELIKETLQ